MNADSRGLNRPNPPLEGHEYTSLLMEQLPISLVRSIGCLPHRLVFQNDSIGVLLIGLAAGQVIRELTPSDELLLVVAYGAVELVCDGTKDWIETGRQVHLEAFRTVALHAPKAVNILFLSPSARSVEIRNHSMRLASACGRFASANILHRVAA